MSPSNLPDKLIVGPAPHIMCGESIARIMWSVVAALCPALIFATINFGWYAIVITIVSVTTAVVTEALIQRMRRVPVTISDGSAVVTGMLLAFTLPPNVPLYVPAVGSIFAIGIAKHAFGGLGMNIWNPALAGRAFLLAAYSGAMVMSKWPLLRTVSFGDIREIDAITRATPCAVLKEMPLTFFNQYSLSDLFIGRIPGSIGETSALALLVGAIYLIAKRYINWRLPFAYILTLMIMVAILPQPGGESAANIYSILLRSAAHALSGGLFIGAFFMATDMVTSPLTQVGQLWFGIGCGILTAIIRLYGGYPEGVCYSILIMNTVVWLIDRLTVPRFFGEGGHGEENA